MTYWPFWLGGLALATVAVGFWLALGKLLGVSGSFATVLAGPDDAPAGLDDPAALEAALMEATRAEFGDAAVKDAAAPAAKPFAMPGRLVWSSHLTLLVMILVGGTIGALTRGAFHVHTSLDPEFARVIGSGWRGWAALAGGGLLVGFGTQMAGGCTSGHGLCGTSRLQAGSLITTAAFFGAAVAISMLLSRCFQ